MAITRRWQSGFELQTTDEFTAVSSLTISNTKAKTGSYSARVSATNNGYITVTATAQGRLAFHFNHLGVVVDGPSLCVFTDTTNEVLSLRYNDGSQLLELWDNAGVIASAALGDLAVQNIWNHISIDFKINAAGWASVRLNGVQIINFSGDTNDGGTSINRFYLGEATAGTGIWANYAYFDDVYFDDCTGEVAATTPPDYRYHLLTPNANGAANQWDGSDGNSTDNYLLVDDIPHDTDTTYVSTDVDGEKDAYGMTTYALAAGESFVSVIPYMYARKEDGASTAQVKLNLGDGSNEELGTLQDLGTSYTLKSERFLLAPDGGAWQQADVDALQAVVEINI